MKNYFILAILVISLTNCSISKRLAGHQSLLAQTAASNAAPQEKLDVVASSLVEMMHQALDFANPKKGAKFVELYGKANQKNISSILTEVNQWQGKMDAVQKIGFGASMLTKDYAHDLVRLIPRFKRKYQQIKFVADVTGQLKKGVSNWGLGKLGIE